MPRFYIDTSDQQRYVRDEDGIEFEDVEAATRAAAEGLADMTRDIVLGVENRTLIAIVRDEIGGTWCQATMSFGVTWMPSRG